MADILEADPRWLVVGEVSLDREKAMITDREFKHILRYREVPDDLKPIVDDFLELVAKRKPLSNSEQGL